MNEADKKRLEEIKTVVAGSSPFWGKANVLWLLAKLEEAWAEIKGLDSNEVDNKQVEEIRQRSKEQLHTWKMPTWKDVIVLLDAITGQQKEIKGLNFVAGLLDAIAEQQKGIKGPNSNEADKKRLEEIRLWWNKPDIWPPDSIGDVKWLLAQIDVLTFKVSNTNTERDTANQEIERLNEMLHRWETDPLKELTAANAKVRRLIAGGHHHAGCDHLLGGKCDCGWSKALVDTEEK